MSEAVDKAHAAQDAEAILAQASAQTRDEALLAMAAALVEHTDDILRANEADVQDARKADTPAPLIDRLMLDNTRIADIADALFSISKQEDPLGRVLETRTLESGIESTKVTVPLGVIAIVYEARPNVTADAAALCIKTGNATILRGGALARRSNLAITAALRCGLLAAGLPENCIQYIEDPSHDATDELMGLVGLIDCLIPRGGSKLIEHCVACSKVPVIETGVGNCHIYVHESADIDMARDIVVNAKCSRPGVCNSAESLLIDKAIAPVALPPILSALAGAGVKLHCDSTALAIAQEAGIEACAATPEDFAREYLDLEMSVACVDGLDEAIAHVNSYGTKHSECIVAQDEEAIAAFLARVDAAAVYANASTRFTDGGEFGLGAEIGISTQKLHARGPMGAAALTSTKYLLRGTGQIR